MTVAERRARQHAELRSQILEAARTIFVRDGYEALTMRKVATEIDYSPTAIYLHFADKAALVHAICEETFTGLIARLEKLHRKHADDPLEYLKAGLRAYVEFGLANPSHYTATFILTPKNTGYDYQSSAGKRAFEFLSGTVGAGVASGRFPKVDVEATAQALWAGVHGLVALLITKADFPFVGRERLITQTISMLVARLER
jgi:AcrR family transcriptional regulator